MKIKTPEPKPFNRSEFFEKSAQGPELPLLDKPCEDCAITTGFYTPIADELLECDEELQERSLNTWFCHNHCNKACRGARNYIESMKKKRKKMERSHERQNH